MDMSSFPKTLQFKRKMLPHPQLLRWSNWFLQWSFQVKHIKGKDNLITDYLSRKPPALNTTIIPPPLCVYPIIDPSSSSGFSSANPNDILNMIENLPSEIKDQIKTLTLMKIQPCHYALDTCKSIRTAPTCPDMNIVHYLQALGSINRTLVILKRQERVKEKKRKLLL